MALANDVAEDARPTLKGIIYQTRKELYSASERAYAALEKLDGPLGPTGEASDKAEPRSVRELLREVEGMAIDVNTQLARINSVISGSESYDVKPTPKEVSQRLR